ncbi:hypothetical protein GRZ55_00965 [Chelativorans sp. ZYF759]|uniref:hypothetical protein n=1 Tax=Chelativorans sp. ZYF759 TaxID=2692213 RepID=UPI00145CBFA1|nr:hypothetical protein [Chelativorans sp. ZYF759]NMG37805.1 hypothetical protein [Chelativorans sp. ZYF759]
MKLRYVLAAALVLAIGLTLRWQWQDRGSFEEEVTHAAVAAELSKESTLCPLRDRAAREKQAWLLAACVSGGLGWIEADARYGEDAAKVFLVYGEEAAFREVFGRIGHPVVPVIAYFVENGSSQYLLQETVGQGLSRLWNDGRMGFGLAEITPEQYGLIAIHELEERGHEFLSEFEVVDGKAVRRQFTRTLLGAKNVVFGGISDLESVIARGERLPTWSEVGWAAFDAVVVVGGIGAAAKALQVARAPIAASRGTLRIAHLRAAGRGAVRSLSAVGTAAGVAAVVALPYVAITRPHLLTSAAGWVAEQAGLPAWLGAFAAYFVLCLIVFLLLKLVLSPLTWTLGALGSLIRLLGRAAPAPRAQA